MRNISIVMLILICLIAVRCSSQKDKNHIQIKGKIAANKESFSGIKYCYIKSLSKVNDKNFIDVLFVDYLTGNAAFEVAKKQGKEKDITDDYYISKTNDTLKTFQLSDSLYIELYYYDSTDVSITHIKNAGFEKLQKHLINNPLLKVSMAKGEIDSIIEQYIP